MLKKLLNSNAFPGLLTVLSVISVICFRSCRANWVFLSIGNFNLAIVLFLCMVVASAWIGTLCALKLWGSDFCNKKAYKNLFAIGSVFASVLTLFGFIYSIGCASGEGQEVFTLYFGKSLAEGALLITVPFFTLFYLKFTCKAKKIIALVSVLAVLLFGVNAFIPMTSYKITCDPMVVDNGSEYSVVFSTNDEGSAYIEYTYEGKDYKIFDNTGGRVNNGKVHSIPVPYEHLRNNTYKVSSTRVIEEFSYGSRRGKTVTSAEYKFSYNDTENQTWLVLSDWHTNLSKAYTAIANFDKDYDGVMLVGDSSPGVDFEKQIITNIIEFGGQVSGGTRPVLYVRGNHETRGACADDLSVYLGIDKFYYTTDIGPYSFVVLDSGEDKEDSHIEYGGMTDYDTYRADMIEWLKGVETKNDKVIALSHAWQISSVEPELSEAGWAELDRLGARLMISGHEHTCAIVDEQDRSGKEVKEKYPDIVAYIDGGKSDKNYIASMLTLNENGFGLKAVDVSGAEIINRQFSW